jgi:hypothetical protein
MHEENTLSLSNVIIREREREREYSIAYTCEYV